MNTETKTPRGPIGLCPDESRIKIDHIELSTRLRNVFTIGELLSCYKPESEPETSFGDIYSNVGFLLMDEMTAAQRAIGEGPAKDA